MSILFNETKFFDDLRPVLFDGSFTQEQVNNILIIKDEFDKVASDARQLAYVYATVFHETAGTFRPIEEYDKGYGRPYGAKLKMGGGPGKRVPYTKPDKIYYGRGFPQLTWYENYESMGKELDLPLLEQPELMLQPKISARALIAGMVKGMFTGKKLNTYITETKTDYYNARRIVNGIDQAVKIAGYAEHFFNALTHL